MAPPMVIGPELFALSVRLLSPAGSAMVSPLVGRAIVLEELIVKPPAVAGAVKEPTPVMLVL